MLVSALHVVGEEQISTVSIGVALGLGIGIGIQSGSRYCRRIEAVMERR